MSSSTSSLSILTTVPVTMSPSSNSTIVPAIASASDVPPRSSATTCLGWYSPASSKVPISGAVMVSSGMECRSLLSGQKRSPLVYNLSHQQELRVVEVRWAGGVVTRRHRPQAGHLDAGGGHEAHLARGEAGGPQAETRVAPGGVLDRGDLVVDPGVGVEGVTLLEVPDGEVGGEARHRQLPSPAHGAGHPGDNRLFPPPAEKAEAALAQADRSVEASSDKGQAPRVAPHPPPFARRGEKRSGDVDADAFNAET